MSLSQTKGKFKLIGKVNRIDKDNAFRTGTQERGQHKGKKFRALSFSVKTSPTNEIFVSTFDYQPEQVFLWNSDKKKKDASYKGDRISYSSWLKNKEKYADRGYTVLQSKVGLIPDEKGKYKGHGVPRYEASKLIHDHLNNGDSVVVEGAISISRSKNKDGEWVTWKNHTIEKVLKLNKEVDFDKENFEEITYFEQEIVFVDAQQDKKEGKTFITGRIIDYSKKYYDIEFVINYKNQEGEIDEDLNKLSNSFLKAVKFGDVINLFGNTVNRGVTYKLDDEQDDDDDTLSLLGGKSKPEHAEGITNYITEFEVLGGSSWNKKVYTDDDFDRGLIDDVEDEDKDSNLSNELGGKKSDNNPFADDDDDDDDLDFDDDVPW